MDINKIIIQIKEKLDIVDVISDYIGELKKRGRNYVALCPFHSEKTPSFNVSREKQLFYCFGCQTGGDIIKFVSLYENITYIEAIKKLAAKANLDIDIDTLSNSNKDDKEKVIIKKINYDAKSIFCRYLRSNEAKDAIKILKERGFKDETIDKFEIGYAPDSFDAIYKELSKKYSEDLLLKSQIITSSFGRIIDTFRDRIIIPVKSISGDIIGFGARAIRESEQPKYLNSSETLVFSKRKNLFGLYNAIGAIRKERKAILVEGYIDAMMMHQYMINIAISPLGTSFTEEQARMIRNYVDEVIIMFDSDNAGVNAALKTADIFVDSGVYPKVAMMPAGIDPDEYLVKNGADEMINLINKAKDIITFKIDMIKQKRIDFNPDEKVKIMDFISPTINKQPNEIIKLEWIKKVSQSFSIPENAINNYLNKNFAKARQQILASQENDDITIENNFIDILITKPPLVEKTKDLPIDYLTSNYAKDIFSFLKSNFDNPDLINNLLEKFPDYKDKIMKSIISSSDNEEIINEENLKKTLLIIKKNYIEKECQKLKERISTLSDEELKRFYELAKVLKNLKI